MEIIQQLLKQNVIERVTVFINDLILKKERCVEQVVFIKGFDNGRIIIEMAGGEFCGNAVRAVLRYIKDKYNVVSCKVQYFGYDFYMQGKCENDIATFSVEQNKLIESIEKVSIGAYKVKMNGITHYVVLESSKMFVNINNKEKVRKFINKNIEDEKSFGVMFLTKDFELFPYVYVRSINTLYFETACGSGAIACMAVIKKLLNKSSIKIKQPSGYELFVKLKNDILSLSGKTIYLDKSKNGDITL